MPGRSTVVARPRPRMSDVALAAGTKCLRIVEHTVHKSDPTDNDDDGPSYLISTLKEFNFRVELCEDETRVKTHDPCTLSLTLLYESGKPVEQLGEVPVLTGGQAMLENGIASFRVKVHALSSTRQQQRFRIEARLDGKSHALGADTPELVVSSQPFRTLTKLHRERAAKRPATERLVADDGSSLREELDALTAELGALKTTVAAIKEEVAALKPPTLPAWASSDD